MLMVKVLYIAGLLKVSLLATLVSCPLKTASENTSIVRSARRFMIGYRLLYARSTRVHWLLLLNRLWSSILHVGLSIRKIIFGLVHLSAMSNMYVCISFPYLVRLSCH